MELNCVQSCVAFSQSEQPEHGDVNPCLQCRRFGNGLKALGVMVGPCQTFFEQTADGVVLCLRYRAPTPNSPVSRGNKTPPLLKG